MKSQIVEKAVVPQRSLQSMPIGDMTLPVYSWNPLLEAPEEQFTYVDLSSISSAAKAIESPSDVVGQNAPSRARQLIRSRDVLVSTVRPNLNAVAWVTNDFDGATASTGFCVLRPNPELLNDRYLYHWVRTPEFIDEMTRVATGASYPAVSDRIIKNSCIPLPANIAEQKRVAAILDHADGIRRKRQQALRLTDEFLRSVFLDMFGDPVANPKGWPKITLGELFKVKSGNAMIGRNMAIGGRFPVYGGNGISGYHDEFMFAERRIVLGRVGVYCGAVHYTQPNSWITDNALYVEGVRKPFNDQYLLASLRFANLNQYAGQAAQPLISGGRIYPIEILDPPLPVQITFAELVAQSEKSKARQEAATSEAENLFQSLQHCAFTGQL